MGLRKNSNAFLLTGDERYLHDDAYDGIYRDKLLSRVGSDNGINDALLSSQNTNLTQQSTKDAGGINSDGVGRVAMAGLSALSQAKQAEQSRKLQEKEREYQKLMAQRASMRNLFGG